MYVDDALQPPVWVFKDSKLGDDIYSYGTSLSYIEAGPKNDVLPGSTKGNTILSNRPVIMIMGEVTETLAVGTYTTIVFTLIGKTENLGSPSPEITIAATKAIAVGDIVAGKWLRFPMVPAYQCVKFYVKGTLAPTGGSITAGKMLFHVFVDTFDTNQLVVPSEYDFIDAYA